MRGGGQRKEIQHEGKGVETIRKATKRGRKRGQGKKIITGGKKNSQFSSTFPGRDRGSRGETAHKSQVFLFFLPPPSSSSSFFGGQRTACYKSISRSNYGTAPILQDACRSVQPQPLLHLFCHIYRLCLCVDVTSHVIDLLTVMCKVRAHSTRQSVSSFPPPVCRLILTRSLGCQICDFSVQSLAFAHLARMTWPMTRHSG